MGIAALNPSYAATQLWKLGSHSATKPRLVASLLGIAVVMIHSPGPIPKTRRRRSGRATSPELTR
jgi:hypothetical protein